MISFATDGGKVVNLRNDHSVRTRPLKEIKGLIWLIGHNTMSIVRHDTIYFSCFLIYYGTLHVFGLRTWVKIKILITPYCGINFSFYDMSVYEHQTYTIICTRCDKIDMHI